MANFFTKFFNRQGTGKIVPTPVNRSADDEFAYQVLQARLSAIAGETSRRYSEMNTLKRFIEGDQWSVNLRASRVQPVTDNLCLPVVEKYVSFFTRSIPKDKIATRPDIASMLGAQTPEIDEEEIKTGFEREQHDNDLRLELLRSVKFEDNDYQQEIISASWNSIGLRNGYLRVVGDEESGKVKITSLNPFHSRIFWRSDDYNQIDGYCNVSMRSIQSIFEQWGILVGEEDLDIRVDQQKTYISMTRFYDAWLNGCEKNADGKETYYLWNITSAGGHVLRNKKYYFDQPIEAVIVLPSIKRANEPDGRSVIEDIVDVRDPDNGLQMQRNKLASDMTDLVRYAPNNIFVGIGTNLGDKQLPTGSEPFLIELGRDQDIRALDLAKPLVKFEEMLQYNLKAIDDKTGMPRAAFGDLSGINLATGIGLSTAFESATARLQLVARNWQVGLQKLNKYIFLWSEYLHPELKSIIGGKYLTEVKFGKMQPRDLALYATVIINQLNAKLISSETAMTELDIVDSPRQEQIKVANEQNNEWLNPELALQKIQTRNMITQTEAAIQQQAAAATEQSSQPKPGAQGATSASPVPGQTPDQNQHGVGMPMSQPGVQGNGGAFAGVGPPSSDRGTFPRIPPTY